MTPSEAAAGRWRACWRAPATPGRGCGAGARCRRYCCRAIMRPSRGGGATPRSRGRRRTAPTCSPGWTFPAWTSGTGRCWRRASLPAAAMRWHTESPGRRRAAAAGLLQPAAAPRQQGVSSLAPRAPTRPDRLARPGQTTQRVRMRARDDTSRTVAMHTAIADLEQAQIRSDIPDFRPGDTLRVHVRVVEGTRRRIQVFQGVVIRRQGGGARETFTVRKISYGVGVERTFPVHSPSIEKIEVAARGRVRRAKLYYLRSLRGKAARIRERREPVAR